MNDPVNIALKVSRERVTDTLKAGTHYAFKRFKGFKRFEGFKQFKAFKGFEGFKLFEASRIAECTH